MNYKYLRRRYLQKPKQRGPVSVVATNAIEWYENHGFGRPTFLFPLWETSGKTVIDIIDGTNGSFVNEPTWTNNQILFDGVDDYIDTGSPKIKTTDFSTFCRFTRFSPTDGNRYGLLGQHAGVGLYWMGLENNAFVAQIGPISAGGGNVPIGSVSSGAFTRKIDNCKIYHDSVQVGTFTSSLDILQLNLVLGGASGTAFLNNVLIDIAVGFEQALTVDQLDILKEQPYAALEYKSRPSYFVYHEDRTLFETVCSIETLTNDVDASVVTLEDTYKSKFEKEETVYSFEKVL